MIRAVLVLGALGAVVGAVPTDSVQPAGIAHLIYASDLHYGLERRFRGSKHVPSRAVNRAMVEAIDGLEGTRLPSDSGAGAGTLFRRADFVAVTGDICNRQTAGKIQSDSASWAEFTTDWDAGLRLRDRSGAPTPLLLSAGNHDVSNAVGFTKPLDPPTDPTSMVGIWNRSMRPPEPLRAADWDRIRHRVHFSREFAGFHLAFVDVWPDSAERVWLGSDLASVGAEPTLLFTHDPPEVDARHFTNPAAGHPLDRAAGFENVLPEVFHDGPVADSDPDREIDSLAAFLRRHPNLFAWFHGHANFDQAYRWRGVPVFRVDSPLKGGFSGLDARDGRGDESLLSFQVVTVDSAKGRLTVRECLWNSARAAGPLRWGRSTTLEVRR